MLAQSKPAAHPQVKGIFEPVNYPEDVEFTDVWFVDGDTGWAAGHARSDAGDGGFIIKTTDAGKTWNLQVGDPHSGTRDVLRLFFLDATHGWASQAGSKLLRTKDGENWETAGDFPSGKSFAFDSAQRGFYLDGNRILMTTNGGGSWKQSYLCRAKVEVEGLPHEDSCYVQAITFATPTVGYILTSEVSDKSSVILKTSDGGSTWNVLSFLPQSTGIENGIGFSDENTGFVLTYQMKMLGTSDGGRTWHGVATSPPGGRPRVRFAGPVGWTINGTTWAYTTDGGKRWLAREIKFPTGVEAFSLPRSDRGYVVGSHGMIYRYSVVPGDYTAPRGVGAPAMTSTPTSGGKP